MAVTEDDDQGVGGLSYADDSVEVTGGEGVYLEKVTEGDKGEGGFSGPPKKGDVIYERPLITARLAPICVCSVVPQSGGC